MSYRWFVWIIGVVFMSLSAFAPASDIVETLIPCAYVRDEPENEEERQERIERDRLWTQLQLYAAVLPLLYYPKNQTVNCSCP